MKNLFLIAAAVVGMAPGVGIADDIQAAANDICACGFPPSDACIDKLAIKYPAINNSRSMQDEVMASALNQCGPTNDSIRSMVGNESLDLGKMPAGVVSALSGINQVVTDTEDCETDQFSVDIPTDWQCRKQNSQAQDVTLYTNGNQLNVSIGINQGLTSCSVIPICTNAPHALSAQFETTRHVNPLVGSHEFSGVYNANPAYKLTITSPSEPRDSELEDIAVILNSFRTK